MSTCSVGCCIGVLCLIVHVLLLHHSVTSPCHVALYCVVVSHRHDMSFHRLIVLSHLASSLHHAPLLISSHPLCSVGCCVVALPLVLTSPCTSRRRDLPLCRSLLSRCVSSCRRIACRYNVPSCSFCHQVWFNWLSRFLPSVSCRMTSR
jgi:hypothetical protein